MSQNRTPPAYQEYAASILSRLSFRAMSLQERGLFYTMRLECWVNERLPQDHQTLAKVLSVPLEEISNAIPTVMQFFEVVDGFIVSPDLEDYRTYLAERKIKQSKGGKRGAAITNGHRRTSRRRVDEGSEGISSSTSQLSRRVEVGSSVKLNPEKPSQTQHARRAVIDDPFVVEYEAAEMSLAEEYARASGG